MFHGGIADVVLDSLSTAIVTADRDGRVTTINRAARDLLRLGDDGILGVELTKLFGAHEGLSAALSREGVSEVRLTLGHRAADATVTEFGMTVLHRSRRPEVAHVLLFRDIAERRHSELEDRRAERLAAIGRLVAGYAHELRNPLAALQGLAELLLSETPAADPRADYARRMLALIKRTEALVSKALAFSEPRPPDARSCEPSALIAAALAMLGERLARTNGRPRVQIETRAHVLADPSQAADCLKVLIDNALDAAAAPEEITVRVGEGADGQIGLSVRDGGRGIPDTELERIFDPFYTTKSKGLGLGLTVAQATAANNGGSVTVRSRPGDTVFTLWLPEAPGRGGAAR